MTGIQQTTPLTFEYFDGKRDLPERLPPNVVGVDNTPYLIDTKSGEWRREGVQVLQQRNTDNPRDLLLLPQDVWRESVDSWTHGSGQKEHDHSDSIPSRFEASFGIDPWEPHQISLLHRTDRQPQFDKAVDATTGHHVDVEEIRHLIPHAEWVVASSGKFLLWYTDSAFDMTAVEMVHPIVDMCSDGEWVYVLLDSGSIVRYRTPTDHQDYMTLKAPANFIDYVKHYLIAGEANVLKDITDPKNEKTVFTAPEPNFTWLGATEGNNAIYLAGGVGDKWVIHRVGVKQDGTGLTPGVVAAELPDGEIAVSVGSYLGFIFIGLADGVRMAGASGSADLVLGAKIPVDGPVFGFEGQDRFVWFTNPRIPVGDGNFVPGLSRIDMSTFTISNFTPAYATDIFADTPGPSGRTVTAVISYGNLRVFAVDGDGVYIENPLRYVKEGWVTMGQVSFGVDDLKTSLYMQGKWKPLPDKCEIEFGAYYDSTDTLEPISKFITKNSVRAKAQMGRQFTEINVRVTLRSDVSKPPSVTDNYQTPVFTRWEVRAKPALGLASRWYVPIIVSDEVELAGGQTLHRDCQSQHDALLSLCQSGEMFPYVEGRRTYQVTAKDYRWQPQELQTAGDAWKGIFTIIIEEVA